MNFFLLMYLNYFRAPQLAREQAEKEEKKRLAQEEEDRKNGIVHKPETCKKCDQDINRKLAPRVDKNFPLCHKCQELDRAEQQAELDKFQGELKMTPFLWFQCFMVLLGLSVFLHRNVVAFF